MIKFKALSTLMAVAVGMGAAPIAAQAQDGANGSQQQMQGAPATIPDAQIESYAAAETRVQEIAENVREQAHQAQTPEQQNEMQQQAQQRMVSVIREEGMSVADYNMIARAASQDPDLRAAIEAEK